MVLSVCSVIHRLWFLTKKAADISDHSQTKKYKVAIQAASSSTKLTSFCTQISVVKINLSVRPQRVCSHTTTALGTVCQDWFHKRPKFHRKFYCAQTKEKRFQNMYSDHLLMRTYPRTCLNLLLLPYLSVDASNRKSVQLIGNNLG